MDLNCIRLKTKLCVYWTWVGSTFLILIDFPLFIVLKSGVHYMMTCKDLCTFLSFEHSTCISEIKLTSWNSRLVLKRLILAMGHAVRCCQKSVKQIEEHFGSIYNLSASQSIRIYGNCHSILATIVKWWVL